MLYYCDESKKYGTRIWLMPKRVGTGPELVHAVSQEERTFYTCDYMCNQTRSNNSGAIRFAWGVSLETILSALAILTRAPFPTRFGNG